MLLCNVTVEIIGSITKSVCVCVCVYSQLLGILDHVDS